jgi:parallel beta-helix repeat protein
VYNVTASPTLTNCTFSGNSTLANGGGIYIDSASPTLSNCTFSGNSATSGGGMYNGSSTPTIRNSILWGDSGGEIFDENSSPTVSYSVVQGGYSGTGNNTGNPLLASIGSYGGATQTMALLPGSAAIDAGNNASCAATDQRGIARPQGSACDIGAFESQGFTLAKTGGDNQSAAISTSFATPLALTVTANNAGEPVNGGVITFTAPGSGASAGISGSPATIAEGAASVTGTANGTAGSYNVVAGAAGATGVSFSLTNLALQLLTINFAGNGGNKVESTSPDQSINCLKGSSSGCSASYVAGTPVTLQATADWRSTFTGWSANAPAGVVTMDSDKTVTATFDPVYKVKLMPNTNFASIQDAYTSVPSGSMTIQAQAWSFLEDLVFGNSTAVTLTGGMDASYNPTSGYSTVKSLTVGTGSAVVGNITIK